uniref:von Willebrand factor A domain-containing protein 5B1 n=1 Tax=Fundulus heteroclitus TaxID=8078 RepID=A0A3Q2PYN1_FUNHE
MVGLRNRSTWDPLLLKASCIKSCANGCSMGITAHLTYANADTESVEGVFVYPLEEKEVVVGFEAMIAGRLVGVHIQSRGKLKDCCLELFSVQGHLVLDEDLERTTFIVDCGVIGPMDIVSVVISTTLELPTMENGAIRIVYPTLLTPVVTGQVTASKGENGGKATSCFGASSGKPDRALDYEQQCSHGLFTSPAVNLAPYELNFQLLVRGACLLAGLESPTHALRADADPGAQSASATYITLAQEHPYDRHIEIILHLSEPHSPLVILERGRLSFSQYEQQICSRRDYVRYTRKDAEPERRVKCSLRYHKDILCNPVLMLNFCPDLLSEPLELHKATRELLFLIDRSGSMTMAVALKSLPSGTMFNIVGFGTTIKPLFTSSKLCTDVSLTQFVRNPTPKYPCHLCRCFGFGLGPRACRRLLQGIAKLTGGTTEFLYDEERLQPKLIKSLKKAFEPVLTDVRIDWYLPENMEALLSPNEIPPLYPGDRLVGYCTLYDMTNFKAQKTELSPPPSSELMPAVMPADRTELEEALREISREISSEFSCARDADLGLGPGDADIRRRIQQSSYIQEQYVLTHCSLSSERSLQSQSHAHIHASSSDSAGGGFLSDPRSSGPVLETGSLPQGLERMAPPEPSSLQKVLARSTMAARSFSSPQGELEMHRLRRALERVSFDQTLGGRLDESDGETGPPSRGAVSHRSLTDSNGLLFPASPLDWESFTDPEDLFTAAHPEDPPPGQCCSIIHGLLSGRPVSWEVTVDVGRLWPPEDQNITGNTDCGLGGEDAGKPWEEIIHHLTARSVIRDFEKLAEKERSGKRYRMKAIQTSKHCNIVCMYTAFTITDGSTNKGLPESADVRNTGTTQSYTGLAIWAVTVQVPFLSLITFFKVCFSYISRFQLGRLRSSISSGKQVPLKSHCLSVHLQLASGAFLLTEIYSECVQIPLDRLKRASPYSLHRRSLSPAFRCTSPSAPSLSTSAKPPGAPSIHHVTFSPSSLGQADSGRGSETDICEGSSAEPSDLQGSSQLAQEDLEGSSWATAVALAWLEHRCAGYFMEWELVAAKADSWLRCQKLPEGVDLAGLRGAARQLFLLLRHWDENIKLNMLCYNPNNM